jgi:hypothetical protein
VPGTPKIRRSKGQVVVSFGDWPVLWLRHLGDKGLVWLGCALHCVGTDYCFSFLADIKQSTHTPPHLGWGATCIIIYFLTSALLLLLFVSLLRQSLSA